MNNYTRKYIRVDVNMTIMLRATSEPGLSEAKLVNVARGGIFVGMGNPPEIGRRVSLRFHILNTRVCEATGTIVWRNLDSNNSGFGVCFNKTNLAMDVFTRSLSTLPPKLRSVFLADVQESTIEVVDAES